MTEDAEVKADEEKNDRRRNLRRYDDVTSITLDPPPGFDHP